MPHLHNRLLEHLKPGSTQNRMLDLYPVSVFQKMCQSRSSDNQDSTEELKEVHRSPEKGKASFFLFTDQKSLPRNVTVFTQEHPGCLYNSETGFSTSFMVDSKPMIIKSGFQKHLKGNAVTISISSTIW